MASSVSGTLRSPVRKSESMLRSLWPDNTWIAVEMVNKASFTFCCLLCLSCQPELSAYSFTNNFYIVSCGHKQNKRGGRVKLQSIVMPVMEFDHPEKGDALYCM
jgi:hypothetical protein